MNYQHNLLQLIDVLRTIADTDVSLVHLKILVQESTTPEQYSQINRCMMLAQIRRRKFRRCDARQTIQIGIKDYYKKCQDFSFITAIHQSLKNPCGLDFRKNQRISVPRFTSTISRQVCNDREADEANHNTQQSITVSPIPKTRIRILTNTCGTNGAKLVFTENLFAIESIMIKIFEYLHLNELSCCRGVCQQWLYDASNAKSVYHVDTFYIRQIVAHFINWKCEQRTLRDEPSLVALINSQTNLNATRHASVYQQFISYQIVHAPPCQHPFHQNEREVKHYFVRFDYINGRNKYLDGIAKYNLNLLNNCQSLTVDATHWGECYNKLDCYSIIDDLTNVFKKVRILEILLPIDFQLDLSNLIKMYEDRVLKCVKLLVTHYNTSRTRTTRMQQLLRQLSSRVNKNDSNLKQETNTNKYILNAKRIEIYASGEDCSIDEFGDWFENVDLTTVGTIKFKPIASNIDHILWRRGGCVYDCGSFQMNRYEKNKFIKVIVPKYEHSKMRKTDRIAEIDVEMVECERLANPESFGDSFEMQMSGQGYFDDRFRCIGASFVRLVNDINQWNQLMSLDCKGDMKVHGINLGIKIPVEKANIWMNVGFDLSKSKRLMNMMQLLYQWHINGNVNANIWFQIQHQVCLSTNDKVSCNVHNDLKKEKWIQLIVKAVKKVFCQLSVDDLSNENAYYPFQECPSFPICVTLCDRIAIKLFAPKRVQVCHKDAIATTLCLMIKAKN